MGNNILLLAIPLNIYCKVVELYKLRTLTGVFMSSEHNINIQPVEDKLL